MRTPLAVTLTLLLASVADAQTPSPKLSWAYVLGTPDGKSQKRSISPAEVVEIPGLPGGTKCHITAEMVTNLEGEYRAWRSIVCKQNGSDVSFESTAYRNVATGHGVMEATLDVVHGGKIAHIGLGCFRN